MAGRDPLEKHRAATPLEALFDLTFAASFSLAASDLASVLAAAHYRAGLVGFAFASFAICWAWIKGNIVPRMVRSPATLNHG